ncbi:MAG: hypothetical protein JXR88_12590 [Clostridia bacterium]|nr:hypothetical protein [Clostridia bacterium]
MKAIYVYSKHVKKDRELLERIKKELPSNVNFLEVDEIPVELKFLVGATPALIFAPNRLQGEDLLNESTDSEMLTLSELFKELEADEEKIYNQETMRLDFLISQEKELAQERMLMEMIVEGRI